MTWHEAAAAIRWNIRPFIDGGYTQNAGSETFRTVNPADETMLAEGIGGAGDVDRAVEVARRRFEDGAWSKQSPSARMAVMSKWADLIVANKTSLALLDSLEMGKPISAALDDAGRYAPTLLRNWTGFIDKLVGSAAPVESSTVYLNWYQPRGVVGAIAPWNFPIVNAIYKMAPALATGNSVVFKPSEVSPSSALLLAELALEAGVPSGVLNVVPGLGSTVGAALALHPDVDMLSFTGSTATGRRVMEMCGRSNGKPVLLECGGKSPQIVFDDANDVKRIAEAVALGFLWNQGQICTARTRLIVHVDAHAELVEQVTRIARGYAAGDPLDEATNFGPLATPAQRDRVAGYVRGALAAGVTSTLSGAIQDDGGCYVLPSIFDAVPSDLAILQEEVFGPVLCVQTFTREDEAIALANATPFALSATVWTRDMGRAKRMAHAVNAGFVAVRTSGEELPTSGVTLGYEPQRASGFGAELGIDGLKAYSTLKSVNFTGA